MNGAAVARRVAGSVLRWVVGIALAILLVPYLLAPLYLVVRPVSTPMAWRWITGARVERRWVAIEGMAPVLPRTVMSAEDARFCEHHGVDWRELREVVHDAGEGGEVRGGSSITQQTAKNLFLWQGRSILRKAIELPLALWIDLVLPKRRILEIYLNIAEWGPTGEFGVEAASRRAFAKSARDLTAREAALLAASLPNPAKRNAARPGPWVSRLASIYQARAGRSPQIDSCVRRRKG